MLVLVWHHMSVQCPKHAHVSICACSTCLIFQSTDFQHICSSLFTPGGSHGCRRSCGIQKQPSPTKHLSLEAKDARCKRQGLVQRLVFPSHWSRPSTACSYSRNAQPHLQKRPSGSNLSQYLQTQHCNYHWYFLQPRYLIQPCSRTHRRTVRRSLWLKYQCSEKKRIMFQ